MNSIVISLKSYRFYCCTLISILIFIFCISLFAPYLTEFFTNKSINHTVERWLIIEIWTPRTLVAIGAGIALALSGAIFQGLTHNPLGSPDIIGINAGASAGAVAVTLIWPAILPITIGALLGAISSLALILLAERNSKQLGLKVIVSGIAVNAFALALVQFGLTGVRQEDAYQLSIWLSGTLAQRTWLEVSYLSLGIPIFIVVITYLQRPLQLIKLNIEVAHTLGIHVRQCTWIGLMLATSLSTIAVISAGPISFLSLAAPHITSRIFKKNQSSLLPCAMIGAILLLLADIIARTLPAHLTLPVGVVTAGLGGIYLCFLVVQQWRK